MYTMRVSDKDNGFCFYCEGQEVMVMDTLLALFPHPRKIGEGANEWAYATDDHNIVVNRLINDPKYKEES